MLRQWKGALVCAVILCSSAVAQAYIRYVPGDYSTIQAAISAAVDTDTITVAPGTWTEDLDFQGKSIHVRGRGLDRTQVNGRVHMDDGNAPTQVLERLTIGNRDNYEDGLYIRYIADRTIRECSISGHVYNVAPSDHNHRGAIYVSDADPVFEDCIVSDNYVRNGDNGGYLVKGAALYIRGNSASPVFRRCTFENNYVESYRGYSYGGAVWMENDAAEAEFVDCVFAGNYSKPSDDNKETRGGAFYITDGSLVFSGCQFTNNTARDGGAIWASSAALSLSDCSFDVNLADHVTRGDERGGSLYIQGNTDLNLEDCIFVANTSSEDGGAIFATGADSLAIESCEFSFNRADSIGGAIYAENVSSFTMGACSVIADTAGLDGGGLHFYRTSPRISETTISDNVAEEGRGGGLYFDGGKPLLTNCVVTGNSANEGGGSYVYSSFAQVKNCTFASNDAVEAGGSFYIDAGDLKLKSSIVWDNLPDQILDDGFTDVGWTLVEGGWSGAGNLDADPLFRDAAGGDHRLQSLPCDGAENSPAIDAGDTTLVDNTVSCDAGLGTRRADMGAYGGPGLADPPCGPQVLIAGAPATIEVGGLLEFTASATNLCEDSVGFTRAKLEIDGPKQHWAPLYTGGRIVVAPSDTLSAPVRLGIPLAAPLGTYSVSVVLYDGWAFLAEETVSLEVQ